MSRLSESSPNISRSMRVFIDYNTDDARRKQRRGVVVEPLVFVMMVSTTAVGVGVNCEVKFFTQNRVPL